MPRRTPAESRPRRAPRRWSFRGIPAAITAALLTPLWLIFTAPPAQAIPGPCDIPGVSTVCDVVDGAGAVADFVSDPLGFIAKKMGEAAAWFLEKIIGLMDKTTKVDFTNPGFLKQYALIFAVATLFTLVLWLIAVAKRAMAGVSLTTAVSEAVGLLLVQVLVNAFTPAVLVLANQLVDEITKVFAGSAIEEGKAFIEKLTKVILATQGTNAPVVLIIVFLIIIIAALLVWIELLIRAGALYIGAALGPIVNAGLVDRDLWGRTKKWAGMLLALLLAKPVLFMLFGLAAAIMNSDSQSNSEAVNTLLVGALLLFLAVFSSASLYKWLPGFGDQMGDLMNTRKAAAQSGPAAAVPGPAQAANSAMNARMTNSVVGGGGGGAAALSNPATAAAAVAKAGVDMAKNKAEAADTIADQGAGGDTPGPDSGGQSGGGSGGTPSTAPSTNPTGTSTVPVGGEGGEGSSTPSSLGNGTANPAGSPVVPADAGGSGEGSSSSSPSSAPTTPTGPSTIPTPASTPAAGPSGSGPTGPSRIPSPTPASAPSASAPPSHNGGGATPPSPASSTQSGTAARAVPSTVPTPSAPANPTRPISGGSGN
ncbi:hypothetical protein CIB93_30760 [Streptomyces sp. WZ.A104]|uniref:hypothetical protein n=1 Tax=Streptomyces sp. WZ.A104 TaxID=2023771 RepID=UPI000BBBBEE1|nr:hypothetical protein [Streptomyces sp. WZ.A104]PCG82291.1 hypothetical protein CIB93_30760 [Streptomyces sp. WZ.A104]